MSNPIFYDPKEEDRLCQILRAYVEEWGQENITITVPSVWKEFSPGGFGQVTLLFTNEKVVRVIANFNGIKQCEYLALLAAV